MHNDYDYESHDVQQCGVWRISAQHTTNKKTNLPPELIEECTAKSQIAPKHPEPIIKLTMGTLVS